MSETALPAALPTHLIGAGASFVDPAARLTPEQALPMLGTAERLHTLTCVGFIAGCNMDREEIVSLIQGGQGTYLAEPGTRPVMLDHRLAVWSPHQDIADGGYWIFVKTPGQP